MILGILQARMSSSRLPGKVLRPLLDVPMIGRQLERVSRAERMDKLVVATSTEQTDDPLAAYCRSIGVETFRGSLDDVLDRFIGAAAAFGPADHVVRLTADCPLADPQVIDDCIALHLDSGADYTTNGVQRSYPIGLDVEAVRLGVLTAAASEAADPYEREHVTWGVWNRPDRYRIAWLPSANADDGDIRWTVDRTDDFAFVSEVYAALYPTDQGFTTADIRGFLARRPDLARFGGDRRI